MFPSFTVLLPYYSLLKILLPSASYIYISLEVNVNFILLVTDVLPEDKYTCNSVWDQYRDIIILLHSSSSILSFLCLWACEFNKGFLLELQQLCGKKANET